MPPLLPVQEGVVLDSQDESCTGFRIVNFGQDGTDFRWTADFMRGTTGDFLRRAEDRGFIEGAQETAPEFPRVDVEFPGVPEGCSIEEQGCDVFISVFSVSPDGRRDGRSSDGGSAEGCL